MHKSLYLSKKSILAFGTQDFSYFNLWGKDKRGSTEHPDDAANNVDHSDNQAACDADALFSIYLAFLAFYLS